MADEAALLDRIRQYDTEALAQVYDEYYDRIYRYVYRYLGQVDAAEDLTANVFLRLLKAVQSGSCPRTNLSAWLYRVAHNLVVDSFRRSPPAELELADWLEGAEADPLHSVEQRLQMEHVRRALLQLTPTQQQVIMLRFLEGLETDEIAHILGKSEGAVGALQHRALVALRQILTTGEKGGSGEGALSTENKGSQKRRGHERDPQRRSSPYIALPSEGLVRELRALLALWQSLAARIKGKAWEAGMGHEVVQ
ncbi:MAG: sigma-70 family RNA polymerase sigma factor [Chloroflexi bacterium]|nr:sigma-70 family RNA polymerase sigma factor [Chloroflexota bacterium]